MVYSADVKHFSDDKFTTVDVGTVNGLRSFDVDKQGRLRSVIQDSYVWKPGENEAEKYYIPDYKWNQWHSEHGSFYGQKTCSCKKCPPEPKRQSYFHGFYSFHDGSDEYRKQSDISGITENYGEVTFGTRGFRSEKAKVVALHLPFYRRYFASRLVSAMSVCLAIGLILAGALTALPIVDLLIGTGITLLIINAGSLVISAMVKEGNPFPQKGDRYELLRQAYDGKVKFYMFRHWMLLKHRLYKYVPPKINFEDPDYWK